MDLVDAIYGKNVLIRCRGTVGTSKVNVNPLGVLLRWDTVFDVAYNLDITSASASDAAAGTGARTITIFGLDGSYNRLAETITLNGQTIVTTVNKFLRVFAAYVTTTGSGGLNAGDIAIVKQGTGGTYSGGVPGTLTSAVLRMLAGNNLGFSGCFTVPAGCTYMTKGIFATARAQAGTVTVTTGNPSRTSFKGPFESLKIEVSADAATPNDASNITFTPKTDIYIQGTAAASGGIMNVTMALVQMSGPALPRT